MKKVTKDNVYIGAKVVRGADWKWGNQDNGEFGTVGATDYLQTSGLPAIDGKNLWVEVRWDTNSDNYRVGPEHHDLYFWEDEFVTMMKEVLEEDETIT